jgi:hypothetical protein
MTSAVKWTTTHPDRTVEFPTTYTRPSEAMDCACVALHLNPTNIWVEDERGNRIADSTRIASYRRAVSSQTVRNMNRVAKVTTKHLERIERPGLPLCGRHCRGVNVLLGARDDYYQH